MKPHDNYDCVLFTVDPLAVQNDSGQRSATLCTGEHNCGPEGKSKPTFLTFQLHPAHYYKFDFKFRVLECSQRRILKPCTLRAIHQDSRGRKFRDECVRNV